MELIEPDPGYGDDTYLDGFLAKYGTRIHHITLKTPDLEQAVATVRRAGIKPGEPAGPLFFVFSNATSLPAHPPDRASHPRRPLKTEGAIATRLRPKPWLELYGALVLAVTPCGGGSPQNN